MQRLRLKPITYAGKRPFTRATYSFRTVPAMNSSVNSRARFAESGMIIKPDVSLSSRLTARWSSYWGDGTRRVMMTYDSIFRNPCRSRGFRSGYCDSSDQTHVLAVIMEIGLFEDCVHEETDERTMLPGLSTTINSRSMSCNKI